MSRIPWIASSPLTPRIAYVLRLGIGYDLHEPLGFLRSTARPTLFIGRLETRTAGRSCELGFGQPDAAEFNSSEIDADADTVCVGLQRDAAGVGAQPRPSIDEELPNGLG